MKSFKNLVLGITILNAASNAMAQAQVEWDSSRAVVAGCDAEVTSIGGDLSITAFDLVVDLTNRVLAGRKSCTVRMPVTVPMGYYVSMLTQKINYQVSKSSRTRGAISETNTFSNLPVQPLSVDFGYGHVIDMGNLETELRTDNFDQISNPSWVDSWCSDSRPETSIYQYNIAISGQKNSASETFIASANGLELKSGIDYVLSRCP